MKKWSKSKKDFTVLWQSKSVQKTLRIGFCILFVIMSFSFFGLKYVLAESTTLKLLSPIEEVAENYGEMNTENKAYEIRKGKVKLDTSLFIKQPKTSEESKTFLMKGNQVHVSFFPDKSYFVVLEEQKSFGADTTLLSGRILELGISTFTLTFTNKAFIINLQDLDNSILYRVIGDSTTGIGIVTEIDQRKLPPMINLPPIIPPTNK